MRLPRHLPWIAAVVVAVIVAWLKPPPSPVSELPQPPQPVPAPPTTTVSDPVEVFQRAFWKRPTANDKILHAERREWAGQNGLRKWNWFVALEPSPELLTYLRIDNAFNLIPSTTVPPIDQPPAWFVINPAAVEILRAPNGGMCLFFSKTGNLRYATDAGGGFHPGAAEAPKPLPGKVSAGRLPLTPPPTLPTP